MQIDEKREVVVVSCGGSPYDIEVLALEPGAVTFTNPIPTPKPLPAQPAPASPPMPGSVASPPSS